MALVCALLAAAPQPYMGVTEWRPSESWFETSNENRNVSFANWSYALRQAALDRDPPLLSGSFADAAAHSSAMARERGCENIVYTISLGVGDQGWGLTLSDPPALAQQDCAFAFLYEGSTLAADSSFAWTVVEVGTRELPWDPARTRRNSRVPKLLPWLFFPNANATIYMDAENRLGDSEAKQLSLREMASSVLGDCGASFAAMAHTERHTNVMDEFYRIRLGNHTAEPDKLAEQEAAYRADTEFMQAVDVGGARMIDGELLVRSNDWSAQQLSSAWMRAYMRGAAAAPTLRMSLRLL